MGNNIKTGENEYKASDLLYNLLPSVGGAIAGVGGYFANYPIMLFADYNAQNYIKKMQSHNSIFKEAAEEYLNKNNIAYTNINTTNIKKILSEDSLIADFLRHDPSIKTDIKKCAKGKHAFVINGKKIYANFDKASFLTFHEMGHVKNSGKTFTKLLQMFKYSKANRVIFTLAFFGAIQPNNNKSDETPSALAKFTMKTLNFLNKNCIALSILSCVPEITDEALATVEGNRIAKGLLSNDMYKKVTKLNRKALLTYITGGIATISAIIAAQFVTKFINKEFVNNQYAA